MLKKINNTLRITIFAFIGVFVGHGLYLLLDYKQHPGFYAMQSAPWYTSILVHGVITVIIVAAAVVIKVVIQSKINRHESADDTVRQN